MLSIFLKKIKKIKSCLDIGCGNGILLKIISKDIDYLGVDANVGIYKKRKSKKLKYFKTLFKLKNILINSIKITIVYF